MPSGTSASALSEIIGLGADLNPFGGAFRVSLGIILDFLGAGFVDGLAANARSFSVIGLRVILATSGHGLFELLVLVVLVIIY